MCTHPRKVLHAVTPLITGTRKSLFVVDTTNGLGENGVVEVSKAHVKAFLDAQAKRNLKSKATQKETGMAGRKRRRLH